jgi:lipoprotein-anchoring transpeptidase ErfK/SrfK
MEKQPEDPQYLKDYIKEHPTNKMAWYLLGRQYAAKGETGKANYCFAQAGEVYRAFEEGTVFGAPDDTDKARETTAEEEANAKRQQSRKPGKWKPAILVLLLLLGSHIPYQPDRLKSSAAEAAEANGTNGTAAPASNATPVSAVSPGSLDVVYAVTGDSGSNRTNQIGEMLRRFQDKSLIRAEMLLLAEPEWIKERKWLLWPVPAKPIVTVQHSDTAAGTQLTYYDAKTCQCEPANRAVPAAKYAEWQNEQLQQLIVRSAIATYEAVNGKTPDKIEQMVRSYPDNWMAGYTPAMKAYFDSLTTARQGGGRSAPGGDQPATAPSGAAQTGNPALLPASEALQQPLRILVDKTTHTLALVSGNVLLRSYPVGLGGDRTPEGEFTITEKVRNPNGRDNGTFGSRGMTLSDTLYAIHGTNQPSSIGKDKSLGCIRMLKPDVEELFDMVPKGTKVVIGQNLLIPAETYRSDAPLRVPSSTDETNPNKTYKWLD